VKHARGLQCLASHNEGKSGMARFFCLCKAALEINDEFN